MITVSGLNFRYREGRFRLRIPDLSIEPGSAVAVIGASGTGKTTFLNLVSGVTVPQSGTVVTNGVDVSSLSDIRRPCGCGVRSTVAFFFRLEMAGTTV